MKVMDQKQNIAVVVVLYNPDNNVVSNINSYIEQVDKILAVDNSEKPNSDFVEKIRLNSKIEYISNNGNVGIAAALNIGARKAAEEGFEYLLTMDQDSEASPLMVSKLLECFKIDPDIAVVAPLLYHSDSRKLIRDFNEPCEQVFSVWTSGSLLNLNICEKAGGFKEELFIDYVDHEFCLRVNKMGHKVYVCNKAKLKHNLGKIKEVNLFFRKVYPTNHSALRLYYRTRNRFYVKKVFKKDFPEFFKQESKDFWRTFLKVILFEADRIKKIRYTFKGYNHYKKNIFGKLAD
jgi:rhamnosyltransferase